MRVNTSGMRSTPTAASSASVAPAIKTNQGDDHRHVEKRLLRGSGGGDHQQADHQHADEVDRYHAVRQRWAFQQPDERQTSGRRKHRQRDRIWNIE